MLRVSASKIDAYIRYAYKGDLGYEKLMAILRRETPQTRSMAIGSAFHKVCEDYKRYYDHSKDIFSCDGFNFHGDSVFDYLNIVFPTGDIIGKPEVKTSKILDCGSTDAQLVGIADRFCGDRVFEYKFTWNPYKLKYGTFEDSFQWRLYCLLFDVDRVDYFVALVEEYDDLIKIAETKQYTYYAYPVMLNELKLIVQELNTFVKSNQLEEYFQPKFKSKEEAMQLKKISIKNVLGIQDLEFTPGKFTLISGANGKGKTSVLNSIKQALNGGKDATLLHNGADKGETVLVLDDRTKIVKSLTQKSATLNVFDKDGKKVKAPASFISKLADMISVDPIEFIEAKPKNRLEILLETLPLEIPEGRLNAILDTYAEVHEIPVDEIPEAPLSALDYLKKEYFDTRTGVNRLAKEKKAAIAELKNSLPEWHYNSDGFEKELSEAKESYENAFSKKQSYERELTEKKYARIKKLREEINRIEEEYNIEIRELESKFAEHQADTKAQIAKLEEKVKSAENAMNTEALIKKYQDGQNLYERNSLALSDALEEIDALKTEVVSGAELVPGMTIAGGDILVDGVPFDKLNSAKQFEVAIQVAKLRAGDLGFVIADGIEKLDDKNFQEFKEQAEKSGLQFIVTKVSNEELTIQGE